MQLEISILTGVCYRIYIGINLKTNPSHNIVEISGANLIYMQTKAKYNREYGVLS